MCVSVILFHLPVPKETLFAFILLSYVGQGFGVSGREQQRRPSRTCERIAEECGCGWPPKAYAILMFHECEKASEVGRPGLREDKAAV